MSRFADIDIDPAVVGAFKRGERAAAGQVYQLLARPVYGLALRILGDTQAADEVTQDTFIDAVEKAPSLRDERALAVWVRGIAVNHCRMRLRSPWWRRRASEGAPELIDVASDAARLNGWCDLEQALGKLPAQTRFVVWMHEVEGYTHPELAALLGRSVSYSKSQLARGIARLRHAANANGAYGANGESHEQ